jgi:protein phosphatase
VKLSAGAFSDPGRVRDNNEDAHVVDQRLALFAVADGMGGHVAGEVASWTAIEALRAAIANGKAINAAVDAANNAVIEKANADPQLSGMGTTMTAAVAAGGHRLLIGHVGDSRGYALHDGTLHRLTDDHSLVGELVREGRLTPEQADAHPQRAIVTRALGLEPDIDVDVYTVDVAAGDRVVLCSDGLTDMVRERDIERILRAETDPQRASEALVDAANAAGGVDNITVVVLGVDEVDDDPAADPVALAVAEPAPTPVPVSAPDVPPPAPPPEPKTPLGRRVRGALLVLIPLLLIAGLAFGAVGWYARRSYFVGLDNDRVVLYKGVPGGVLGWDPTIEERSDLRLADLDYIDELSVTDGAARGSRDKAVRYLEALEARVAASTSTTTSTTTTSTTTTVPALVVPAPPAPVP